MRIATVMLLLTLMLSMAACATPQPPRDIVIYGGTSSAITAAVQAKKMGKSVVIVSPDKHLGGLSSGGLGATDIGNKAAIGGLSREFYHRVWKHYQDPAAWNREKPEAYVNRGRGVDAETMWFFEPHVAEDIFNDWVREHDIEVAYGRLDLDHGVNKQGGRIISITTEDGRTFPGRMFIDTTYEGDLMAEAGVSYHVGREANSVYNETLNGWQPKHNVKNHRFPNPVDPYVKHGDPRSGLLPGIGVIANVPADGAGDKGIQAYCFRMCTTDVPANRLAWVKPDNYNEQEYELLLRNFEAGDLRAPWHPLFMPNRKTDTNNSGAVSTDWIGRNHEYADADYAARERIVQGHRNYQQGLMWTLAHNPRVPEKVREEFQRLGLAKDEFTDNEGWPHQLYIREARRMIGDYVMTEHNCRGVAVADNSVGMGAYGMDSHNVWRYVTPEGHIQNEGDVQVGGFSPYPIAYRSIVPKASECENLLVPVCLSASHIAYGSIRMEPVFMLLGQSAATAAAQAIDQNVAVQKIDPRKLRERLLADGQVLEWSGAKRVAPLGIKSAGLPGVVIDDEKAMLTGAWSASASNRPFVDIGYRHAARDAGGKVAMYTAKLPKAGQYEVRLSYSPSDNRASNASVTIDHADGTKQLKINQRDPAPIDGLWLSLGTYRFTPDKSAIVTIRNDGANGYVIIDAVQFLPVK